MIRKLAVSVMVIIFLAAAAGAAWYLQLIQKPTPPTSHPSSIHHFEDAKIDLTHIIISVFYFVPQDREENIFGDWQSTIKKVMDETVAFHANQFKSQSELTYRLYPKPVIGQETVTSYAQDDTPIEPKSLGRIIKELDRRVFQPSGDLFDPGYSQSPNGSYIMKIIIYEADPPKFAQVSQTGEIGGYSDQNTTLVARKILTDLPNQPYGPSIVYHEIGHMIGLPESYDYQSNQPSTNDIMGSGRSRPIQNNYLNPEVLKKMGVRWNWSPPLKFGIS